MLHVGMLTCREIRLLGDWGVGFRMLTCGVIGMLTCREIGFGN